MPEDEGPEVSVLYKRRRNEEGRRGKGIYAPGDSRLG